jgi:hypothetical protein
MTVIEFLAELKKERLSGREFLALIGHTQISNEDYNEIKENPMMTYDRLVEILQNAPVSPQEYADLLKTARTRREKQARKKNREDLENRLSAALSSGQEPITGNKASLSNDFFDTLSTMDLSQANPQSAVAVLTLPDVTEEISLDSQTNFSVYEEPTGDDLWESAQAERSLETADLLEEFAEYGGKDDFDRSARRENLVKIIICLSLGVVLGFSSFLVRYLGLSDYVLPPQSYEEIFELQQSRSPRTAAPAQATRFRAENYTEPASILGEIAANDRYIFKIIGDEIRAVEIDAGEMGSAPAFRTDKPSLGIFERFGRLFAVYEGENIVYIYEFYALSFDAVPLNRYKIEGRFVNLTVHEQSLILVTDFVPTNRGNPADYAGYIPAITANDESSFIAFENIEFIPNSPYTNITVIGVIGRESAAFHAVLGNSPDCVYVSQAGLILGFHSSESRRNESFLLRYSIVSGNISSPAWGRVDGQVRPGFIDERGQTLRVVTDYGNEASLFMLDRNMNISAPKIGKIAVGKPIMGAAFDNDRVFVIAGRPGQHEIYATDTSDPRNPVFLKDIDTIVSDDEFFFWSSNRFFSVKEVSEPGGQRGVEVVMYFIASDGSVAEETTYRLPPEDEVWFVRTVTSVKRLWSPASSHDFTAGEGVIVIPVTYEHTFPFIECFFLLNYRAGVGFSKVGSIVNLNTDRSLSAVISGGYVYTIWGDAVKSAALDSTVIATNSFLENNNA